MHAQKCDDYRKCVSGDLYFQWRGDVHFTAIDSNEKCNGHMSTSNRSPISRHDVQYIQQIGLVVVDFHGKNQKTEIITYLKKGDSKNPGKTENYMPRSCR